jgi:hypothetical protein
MTSPEEIKRNIDVTRNALSADVEALHDKVSPSKAVGRQVDKTRSAIAGVKDKVMGSVESVSSSASDGASSVGDAISGAPHKVSARAQGNPLAAGLIAFGAGWLISSLLPASTVEKKVAGQAKEHAQPMIDHLTDSAAELKDTMAQPLHEAVDSVRSSATDATSAVADDGRSAFEDVKSQAVQAKDGLTS